ncbi:MAG: hypothetical protein KDA32_00130 [Phycisphaerales bacterium]|nr:hypothetical protein [Phycisphaerales bacterium]
MSVSQQRRTVVGPIVLILGAWLAAGIVVSQDKPPADPPKGAEPVKPEKPVEDKPADDKSKPEAKPADEAKTDPAKPVEPAKAPSKRPPRKTNKQNPTRLSDDDGDPAKEGRANPVKPINTADVTKPRPRPGTAAAEKSKVRPEAANKVRAANEAREEARRRDLADSGSAQAEGEQQIRPGDPEDPTIPRTAPRGRRQSPTVAPQPVPDTGDSPAVPDEGLDIEPPTTEPVDEPPPPAGEPNASQGTGEPVEDQPVVEPGQDPPAEPPVVEEQPTGQPEIDPGIDPIQKPERQTPRTARDRGRDKQPVKPTPERPTRTSPRRPNRATHPAGEAQPEIGEGGLTDSARLIESPDVQITRPPTEDGRTEWFAFDGMPFEDVIAYFIERIGKPALGAEDAIIGGDLTYTTTERFTQEEAVEELNYLLLMQGYFLYSDERFTYVLREGDIPKFLETTQIYDGIEAFRAANLRPLQFVSVLIQIKDRRAEDVRDLIAPSMPDRALPVVVGEANKIRINGFAMDVERFMQLLDVLKDEFYDPRNTKIFKIQTNAQVIEGMLRDFFELNSPVSRFRTRATTQRSQPQPAAQQMDQESFDTLKIIADTRTNSIIAKGTPEELKEVESFIEQVDVKPEIGEFTTKVKVIQYADAEEVANLLNQIFEQEQGESRTPGRPVPQRGRTVRRQPNQPAQQNQANPEDIIVEDVFEKAKKTVRIVPDARRNAIVVYATDDGHKRVDELLEGIDQPVASNVQTFELKYADATEIEPLVQQIVQGAAPQRARGGGARGPSIVADTRQNALHVVADREDMTRVAEVIRDLDIEIPEDQRQNRHVVELVNVTPSRVAQVINPILSGNAGSAAPRGRGGRRAPSKAAPTSQVIPLDEAGLLIVVCTDDEWTEDVEPVIRDLDAKAVSDMPVTHTFQIEKGNAQSIADTLERFFRQYQHPTLGRSNSEITVTENGDIMVRAVQPAIDEMISLVQQLDVEPDGAPLVIIPLAYADAAEVAQYAQMLLPEDARGRRRGQGGGSGPSIEAEPATNSLIIRANTSTVDEVRAFVTDYEQRVAEQQPETRYYTPKFSNPREVASAIMSLHGGGGGGRGRNRGASDSRVQAFDSGPQLVVEAPVDKFPAIEALIAKLDDPAGQDIVIKTIRLPGQGQSVSSIASRLNNAFREQSRQQPNVVARFEADPTTETILVTASRSTLAEAERLLTEYQAIGEEIEQQIEFRTLEHANANDAANWLRDQLTPAVERQFGSTVARLIRVTGDDRTNRVILNAPQVAVQMGLSLLSQYDVESKGAPETPVEVKTFAVAGMDVSDLARNLERVLGNAPARPDKLRRVVSSDATTGTLIVSAPRDEFPEIERLVNEFVAKSEDVEPIRRNFHIDNAEAAYVADQLRNQLNVRVGYTRGRAAASLINVSVDTRLNNVLVNAPRYAMSMAEELIQELDQTATKTNQIRTIELANADAQHVFNVLQQVLREQIRTKRTLQISAEPMTNSIIVSGADEDFNDIESWAKALDERAANTSILLDTVELHNIMNPYELINVLNGKYNSRQTGKKANTEYAFYPVGGGSTLVVQAPAAKMDEVKALVAELDASAAQDDTPWVSIPLVNADPWEVSQTINEIFGASRRGQTRENQLVQVRPANGTLIVRAPEASLEQIRALVDMIDKPDEQNIQIKTYDLEVLDATQVAMQVQFFLRSMGQTQRRGQLQPGAFAEPTTNTLIVMAPARNLPFIDSMITKIEMKKPDTAEARSYELKFAKAEIVAQSLDQMLRAKAMESPAGRRGGAQGIPTSVVPDSDNNRVVVFAPPQLQDLADDLVKMMDTQSEGEITQIIEIENGSAEEIADTVRQTTGSGGFSGFFGGRGRGGRGFFPGFGSSGDSSVRVVADTGSNSIILSGRKEEIQKLYELIKELDTRSNAVPEFQIFALKYKRAPQMEELLSQMAPFKGADADSVSITADEWKNELLVSANKQMMRQVETYLQLLDKAPDEDATGLGDRELYFIKIVNGDAFDIAYDVSDMFPPESEGGPVIDSTWTGNQVKVICYPHEFERIEKMVRKIEAATPMSYVIKTFKPKASQRQFLDVLSAQNSPDIDVILPTGGVSETGPSIVEPLWDEGEVPERIRRKRARTEPTGARKEEKTNAGPTSSAASRDNDLARFAAWHSGPAAAGADLQAADEGRNAGDVVQGSSPPTSPDGRVQVVAMPDGTFVIKGPEMAVRDFEDRIDLIEEDLDEGEVIRIFEFRYGDVNTASRILDMMFNQRTAARQQVRPQLPNQRNQQGGDKGGEDDRQQQQQQQMLQQVMQQQQQAAAGAGGGSGLRIATDPGNNYLIVKCQASLLPEVRTLLRELDIPPGEVIIRLFRLENIGAEEAADALNGALGLGGRQGGRSTRALDNLRSRGGGSQIMDVEESRAVKIEGLEPAKIEATEIVPNAQSNTLLVSAPVEVMAVIQATIKELEDTPGGVIVVNRFELQNAKVSDVLPLLSELFANVSGGGDARGRGGSPSDIGPVWVSGDARINAIVYSCRERDVPRVEEQIRAVDIEGAMSEAETYVCQYGDATAIAGTAQEIYGGGSRGGGRRGSDVPLTDIRVSADPVSNSIIVWGPGDARREILATAKRLDELAKLDVREIPVNIANPEKLADKLAQMFGGIGGSELEGGQRRGGGSRQVASMTGRIVVIGDQAAKKIFVRAPDHIYKQMSEMALVLDQNSMGLEIRNFPLKHARAEEVVTQVEQAFAKYMMLSRQLEGGGGLDIDAFTAVPDTRTNSVTVLGSEQTFAFVKTLLAVADVETPEAQRKTFRVFSLQEANADVVAAAINNFASGASAEAAMQRGGGRNPMMAAMSGGSGGSGETLDVQAVAEPATNSVLVFGVSEDIDKVDNLIIQVLESSNRREIASFDVKNALPSEVVSSITPYLLDEATGLTAAVVTPNDDGHKIIVWGTQAQVGKAQRLIEEFDSPDLQQHGVRVIQIPLGQDAVSLAGRLQRVLNDGERARADATGRQARTITIEADDTTNTLLVYGDPAMYGMAEGIVRQLADIRPDDYQTVIIQLTNISSTEAADRINEMQNNRRGGGGGGSSSSIRPTSGRSSSGSSVRPRSGTRNRTPRSSMSAPTPSASPSASPPSPTPSRPVNVPRSTPRTNSGRRNRTEPGKPRVEAGAGGFGRFIATMWLQDAGDEPNDAELVADDTQAPGAEPAPSDGTPLQSISGQLRGDVVVTPIDSRQVMITGDRRDIDFVKQMLALMEQASSAGDIRVFKLKNTTAAAIEPIITTAITEFIGTRTDTPDRGDRFSVIAESRSNSLIVTASERNMPWIEALIQRLDVDSQIGFTTRVYAVQNLRAAEAVALLEPILQRLYTNQGIPAAEQPSVTADARSNKVIIVGTDAHLDQVEELLKGIDVDIEQDKSVAAFSTGRILILPLKNNRAEDLAEVLNQMIESDLARDNAQGRLLRQLLLTLGDGTELPPLNLDKPIRILPVASSNSLMVFSSEENNNALQEIVRVFDTLPEAHDIEIKSYRLEYAQAETVATLVQAMFDNGKKALMPPSESTQQSFDRGVMPPQPPGLAPRGLPYNVVVQHEARTNTVFVIGQTDAVLLAAGVIQELDRPSTEFRLQPEVIHLRQTQASQIAEQLTEVIDQRMQAIGVEANRARDGAILRADDRSNSLIVVAAPEMLEMVRTLATSLDDADASQIVATEMLGMQKADAVKLASLLQEMFDRRRESERDVSPDGQKNILHVLADNRTNSLLLVGTRDYLNEAKMYIDNLDRDAVPTTEVRLRPVLLGSASNIARLLQEMVDRSRSGGGAQGQQSEGTPIYIAADPYSNSLLLSAAREDMTQLERWIEILDKPLDPGGRVTRVIPVRRGDAEQLAQRAQEIYQVSGQQGAGSDVTVFHDPSTNAIVVVGPPIIVHDIESLLDQLDSAEARNNAVVKIYKLTQTDVELAGELLRNILGLEAGTVTGDGGGAGGAGSRTDEAGSAVNLILASRPDLKINGLPRGVRQNITVIDNTRTNEIVVIMPPESVELLDSLIAAVDQPPDAVPIRVIRLRNSDAEQMVTMLNDLFEQQQQSGQGAGGTSDIAVIGAAAGRQELRFTTEPRTNSIVAAGTEGYLDLLEELVIQLDSVEDQPRQQIVYNPRYSPPASLREQITQYNEGQQQILGELENQISATAKIERQIGVYSAEESNRLIVDFSPRRREEVLDLLNQLDQPPSQVMIEVLIVEVTVDNSLDLGVEFAFQDLQFTKAGPTDTTTFDFVGGTDLGAAGTGLGGFSFTITGADFNFLLRTLQNEGSLNVLSRPQIVAMDGQQAIIDISNDVPYVTGTSTSVAGQVTTQVARERIGIRLEVTPQINPDNFVRMEVHQEVSDLTDSTVDVGQGVTAPVFFRREAETTVSVRDAETVVLGGLITSRENRREQKIPILGDVPILGLLASNRTNETRRNELLLVLTPRVVRTVDDFRDVSVRARDESGILPPDVLSSRLMGNLRVRPERLAPTTADDTLGPFPGPRSPTPGAAPRNAGYDIPLGSRGGAPQLNGNAYEIPLTLQDQRKVKLTGSNTLTPQNK